MKIGILTLFYKNYNYGAQLQAFALCKVLNDMQFDCKQINYDYCSISLTYKPEPYWLYIARLVRYRKWYYNYLKTKNKFDIFNYKIPQTQLYNVYTIPEVNDHFDAFITGSDQVWNPAIWNSAFFLDFVSDSKIKVGYSISTGVNYFEKDEIDYLKNKINNYDYVSFRENDLFDLFSKLNYKVEVMPDPTFLLTLNEWSDLASDRKIEERYILCYLLGNSLENIKSSIEYSKKNHIKIYFISSLIWENRFLERSIVDKLLVGVSIEDFLSLIKNADLVITDSFHGVVFSCIFQRSFVVFNRFNDEDTKSMNSRISSLMKNMQLNKIVKKIDYNDRYLLTDCEKESIRHFLEIQRNKGLLFLKKTLDNNTKCQ